MSSEKFDILVRKKESELINFLRDNRLSGGGTAMMPWTFWSGMFIVPLFSIKPRNTTDSLNRAAFLAKL